MRKMFAVIFFAGTYFCGSLEKSHKLEPAKILCQMVHMSTPYFTLHTLKEFALIP